LVEVWCRHSYACYERSHVLTSEPKPEADTGGSRQPQSRAGRLWKEGRGRAVGLYVPLHVAREHRSLIRQLCGYLWVGASRCPLLPLVVPFWNRKWLYADALRLATGRRKRSACTFVRAPTALRLVAKHSLRRTRESWMKAKTCGPNANRQLRETDHPLRFG